jgi:hypothetical protein
VHDEFEPTAATLRGDGFEAVIGATAYTESDGDMVDGAVRVAVTGTARFEAAVSTTWLALDLEAFKRELEALHSTLSGKAVLFELENRVELKVELQGGRGTISGFAQDHVAGRLEFDSIVTDQSYLFDVIEGLRHIVEVFPSRGGARGVDR